jgi:polar amino acid transport system substrate-binding protein
MPFHWVGRAASFVIVVSVLMPGFLLAETLEAIRQRGHLIVAVKNNLPPLGFQDATGKLQGLEIEIAQRLSQDLLGRQDGLILQPTANVDRLAAVVDGRVDIAIAHLTATAARSRVVTFTVPYYLDGTALLTQNPLIRRIADIKNQPIAVLNGSSAIATLRYRLPTANLIAVDSYQAAQAALATGKVVAVAADGSVLSGWLQKSSQYRILPTRLSVEPLCIVLPKGLQYDELRRQVNVILLRWQEEGWLQARIAYWKLPQ